MQNTISNSRVSATINSLWKVISNTPLFVINFKYKGEKRTIYVKSESPNFTGSIKDRMALYIIQCAYERGEIKPEDTIAEATSGNTGIAFSSIGRALGHKVKIAMPDWMSRERVDIIRCLGAEIVHASREEGGFLECIRITEEMKANEPNIFLPCQFSNENNVNAHEKTTGPEIWNQMQAAGVIPDVFVAGVGTGGTVMGVGRFLRSKNPNIKVYPMEPAQNITADCKLGAHRIQGISDDFLPSIVKLNELEDFIRVSDGDGIIMAQKLANQLGIAVGISSGANFVAALIAQEKSGGKNVNVATVFPDCNKKYLSTDLMREEPIKEEYYSPNIELIDFSVIKSSDYTITN